MSVAVPRPSHDKRVDSPMCHRDLKNHGASQERDRAADRQEFHIGTAYQHSEPAWEQSQRYGCNPRDHNGMLTDGYPQERKRDNKRDHSGNHDWTNDTGSSVQKVLKEKHENPVTIDKTKCDAWANSSNAKVLPQEAVSEKSVSPKRGAWEDKTVPNEPKEAKRPSERGDLINAWNTESLKTLPKEEKRVLNLAPNVAPPTPPKKLMRPEDWDSNLKTLPDAQKKGVAQRHAHTYEDIKDSVVRDQVRRTVKRF